MGEKICLVGRLHSGFKKTTLLRVGMKSVFSLGGWVVFGLNKGPVTAKRCHKDRPG